MDKNPQPNNPWEARRVNMNKPPNLMQDIKKPAPSIPVFKNDPAAVETPITPTASIKEYDSKKPSYKKFYVLFGIIFLLLAGAGYTAYYFYQKANKIALEVSKQPADQLAEAVNEIGKLVVLPINDNPTLSVVVDAEEAKKNSLFALFKFFETTQAGDMWLSYQKTGKNILYRPSIKKIVNMMTFPPDALNTEVATSTATTTKTR
jgi:hypothetical protein